MSRMIRLLVTAAAAASFLGLAVPAFAHPHVAQPAHQGDGQEIANGQLHGPFTPVDPTNPTGPGITSGGDPAAYGLETAHHGPDSGTPGKADGYYQTDSMPPGTDDNNPAIG